MDLRVAYFVLFAIVQFVSCTDHCKPLVEKPAFNIEKIPNVADTDNYEFMAAHAGYGRWPKVEKDGSRSWRYGAIGVGPSKVHYNKEENILNINSKCSNITIKYSSGIKSMQIDFNLGDRQRSCAIRDKYPEPPYYLNKVYYSCREFRQYNCSILQEPNLGDNSIMKVALLTFTYELYGNPEVIKKGNYSKTEYFCV